MPKKTRILVIGEGTEVNMANRNLKADTGALHQGGTDLAKASNTVRESLGHVHTARLGLDEEILGGATVAQIFLNFAVSYESAVQLSADVYQELGHSHTEAAELYQVADQASAKGSSNIAKGSPSK